MGYVYLIHDKSNNTYKIGVARAGGLHRVKKLQTGNSTELDVIYNIQADYPFRLETMLHNYYKGGHVLNEWYNLTEEQVKEFPNKCELFKQNIEALKDNPFFNKKGLK